MPLPVSRTVTSTWSPARRCRQRDLAVARRVAEGVGQQVRDHLADPRRVDLQRGQVVGGGDGQGDAGLLRLGAVAGGDIGEEGAEVRRLAVEDQAAGLGQRQGPEVLDQSLQDAGLGEDRLEVRGIGRIDAVDDAPRGCPGSR